MSEAEPFPIVFASHNRSIPSPISPLDPTFEDEMATSDEDNDILEKEHDNHQPSDAKGVSDGYLDAQVRVYLSSGDHLLTGALSRSKHLIPSIGKICDPPYNWPSSVAC